MWSKITGSLPDALWGIKLSKSNVSMSLTDPLTDAKNAMMEAYDPTFSTDAPRIVVPLEVPKTNVDYLKKIDHILSLAVGYDPFGETSSTVMEIKNRYLQDGVLTKQDMEVLNGIWKILSFEEQYHPDRESVIGKIRTLLGRFND